jgi:hypothetical protein
VTRTPAKYSVRFADHNTLRYEDEHGSLEFWVETNAAPWGYDIDLTEIPPNFGLSCDELVERIWRKIPKFAQTVRFFDAHGSQIFRL